ncbi:MAG: hypothetical protein KF832_20170, partial [Caldilineaceae bacterium]|nr:hypothetical protein [Caldilineaceae bacterium]
LPTATPPPTAAPFPTATLPPTATRQATATATATKPPPPPTPTPVVGKVTLVTPLDNEASGTRQFFQWKPDFMPADGYAFELIFWPTNQDPMRQGFGVAAPTRKDNAMVDLPLLDIQLGDRLEPRTYQWGVLLVRTTPSYERVRFLGGGWYFTYRR